LFGKLADGGKVKVLAPGEQGAEAIEKTLVLKVTARKSRKTKALPASAE